jgi:DNA topoisomerase-1
MDLLIVESPAKAKKIQSLLGDNFIVKSSVGHVCDLPKTGLGIDTDSFHCKYVVADSKRGVVSGLKKAMAQSNMVYLATDLDREGEAIAWHLHRILKPNQYQRIVFNEITKSAIQSALGKGRLIDQDMVLSQESRRIIDRLVGFMVSPEINARSTSKLTAGRVQSVAVLLVVENDMARASFTSVPYNVVTAKLNHQNIEFHATFDHKAHQLDYLQDMALTQAIANTKELVAVNIETKEKATKAPPPLITSTYTQAVSIKHKIRPKDAMSLAQTLFEAGLITYHRTDSAVLSDEATSDIRDFLQSKNLPIPETPNKFKVAADAQEAHEAIRPSNVNIMRLTPDMFQSDVSSNINELNKAYQSIWLSAVASQMLPCRENVTSLIFVGDDKYQFSSRGVQLIHPGWKQLTKDQTDETELEPSEQNDDQTQLPVITEGQRLNVVSTDIKQKKTTPPPLFTEASLTKALEREGVGRPATYAAIMEKIISYGYVSLTKNKLESTQIGQLLYKTLKGQFTFMDVAYTRGVESSLDGIAKGNSSKVQVCKQVHDKLTHEISQLTGEKVNQSTADENVRCLECDKPMRLVNNKFWGCTGFDDGCKVTYQHVNGKPIIALRKPKIVDENAKDCPKCKNGKLIKRKGKKGDFYGCSAFPKCKHIAN